MRQLNGVESEVKALRSMTQRMILTQKEMVHTSTVARVHLYFVSYFENLLYIIIFLTGRSCSKEVLACSLLGFSCKIW